MGHGPWVLRLYFQPLASGTISGRWPPVLPVLFSSGTIFSFPVYFWDLPLIYRHLGAILPHL